MEALLQPAWTDAIEVLRSSKPGESFRPDPLGQLQISSADTVGGCCERGAQVPALLDLPGNGTATARFQLGPIIGQGGMGVVVEARQQTLQREIALKIAHSGSRQAEQVLREASCTAALEHPNIVPVHDAGTNFMAMKRFNGTNLEVLLEAKSITLTETVDVLLKVCDALAFAHSRGVVHRDVKPDNIMVGAFGEVLLVDWGLAISVHPGPDGRRLAQAVEEIRGIGAGTPGYIAPEMVRAQVDHIGTASDVFLLGGTLYRVLSGSRPFDGSSALDALLAAAANTPRPLAQLAPEATRRLVQLVHHCMLSDPTLRPRVLDVQQELRAWLLSANGESEAQRCFQEAQAMLSAARAQKRREDGYALYNEAISLLDRAATLNPGDPRFHDERAATLQEFSFSAACVGETFLVRLLKRGGTLPRVSVPIEASAARRAVGVPASDGERQPDGSRLRIAELESEVGSLVLIGDRLRRRVARLWWAVLAVSLVALLAWLR